jgi:cytochrome c-type biogenesis protein CcmH
MLMGLTVVVLLTVGGTRDNGPLTQSDRIDSIARRVACPTCDGESVYASRAPASEAIRNQIAREVAGARLTDDQIIAGIASSFDARVLLVPRATGIDALVWVLPVAAGVCAVTGLGLAFRRWRRDPAMPTAEDESLVGGLLADRDHFDDRDLP